MGKIGFWIGPDFSPAITARRKTSPHPLLTGLKPYPKHVLPMIERYLSGKISVGQIRLIPGRWGRSLVEELLVTLAEAAAVVSPGWAGDGRVAVARVVRKVRRTAVGHVIAGGLKAIVDALVVDLHARRRWAVDRLWMRAPSQQGSHRKQGYSEKFFHEALSIGCVVATRSAA
jgi:hypothetical protein